MSGSKCGACQHITKVWFGGRHQGFLCEIYDLRMSGDCGMARFCSNFKRKPYSRKEKHKGSK